MKILIVLAAVVAVALAAETYTVQFDNVNVDEILRNDRLVEAYFKCLMDRGTCTPDGRELKMAIPDALTNKCQKCSERQKEGSKKVVNFLLENKPEMWKELEAKYDPQGIYKKQYAEEARKQGIKI